MLKQAMTKKVLISLVIIGIVAVFAIGGTIAYFSDTETSSGNTFSAGLWIDLQVGDDDPTTWKIDAGNILPGDSGDEEVLIRNIGTDNGYLHITFANLVNDDVSCVEPEREAEGGDCGTDPGAGELAENLDILIYLDENGDNDFDLGTDTLIYQGKVKGILQGDLFNYFLTAGASKDFRVEWSIDASVGNEVQSDKTDFDIIFELTQIQKEIVGDWHFDENSGSIAYDNSGFGNTGTINGAAWADGKYNPALSFDGTNDYAEIADSDSFHAISNEITMEARVKVNSNKNYNSIIVKDIDGKEDFELLCNAGGDCYSTFDGITSRFYKLVDTNLQPGVWTHLAVTYKNGGDWVFYKNGAAINTTPGTQALKITSGAVLRIGDETGTAGRQFNGTINEVKIYNRALSPAEIFEHYQAEL